MSYSISVIGMGYVGLVGAVCLAQMGHTVVGMDVDERKINLLKQLKPPIFEPKVDQLLNLNKDKLSFTTDIKEAILNTDISFVAVGTPSRKDGKVDLSYVETVSKQIGEALKHKDGEHLIVFRSTIPPKTSQNLIIPLIEKYSGKKEGKDFFYAFNPEFLREGTAVDDFFNPPKTVVGSNSKKAIDILFDIYKDLPEEKIALPLTEAETIKYVDNVWHALKVSFANEIGLFCKQFGADGRVVMDVFVKDRKLNISPTYLKPGFAFGGSCLPKDTKGLVALTEEAGLVLPLIRSVLASNQNIIEASASLIRENMWKGEPVVIAGIAFKPDTDDVRESPAVYLARKLFDYGIDVKYFDPIVKPVHIKSYFGEGFIPLDKERFLSNIDDVFGNYKNIVFTGSYKPSDNEVRLLKGKKVFDLGGVLYGRKLEDVEYYALGW